MSMDAAELAVGWIEAWQTFDMEWLRGHLSPDFVHTSPFGRFEDRETYLAAVEPMARKSVAELRILRTVASGDEAVIRFENRTVNGVVETCDWIRVQGDRIVEVRSFYDTATVRRILTPTEQASLDGSRGDRP